MTNLVTFFAAMPTVPNALRGSNTRAKMSFCGGFDKINHILYDGGSMHDAAHLLIAAAQFEKGAGWIAAITGGVVKSLTTGKGGTVRLQQLFAKTRNVMTSGFTLLQGGERFTKYKKVDNMIGGV